jgi:hypothetical protein
LTSLGFGDGDLSLNALETLAESAVLDSLTGLSVRFANELPLVDEQDWRAAADRLFAAVAPRLESLTLETPTAEVQAAFASAKWPQMKSVSLSATGSADVATLTAARLPRLRSLQVWSSHRTTRPVWSAGAVDHFVRWPSLDRVNELTASGLTTDRLRELLHELHTPEMASLSVFAGRPGECRLSAADLAERDTFRGLKTLRGPFTNADLAALSDPEVLPELHTVWSGDSEPLTGLRWRGGVRTVIPKDTRDAWRIRPSRGSWCSS